MKFCHGLILAIAFAASAVIASEANAYYEAMMGRFLTRDPAGETGFRIGAPGSSLGPARARRSAARDPIFSAMPGYADSANLYEYVRGEPLIHVDPNGTTIQCIGGGGFAGWEGAVAGSVSRCWDDCGNSGIVTCFGGGIGGGAGYGGGYSKQGGCMKAGWGGQGQFQFGIGWIGGGASQDFSSGDWSGSLGVGRGTKGLGGCATVGPCYTRMDPPPEPPGQVLQDPPLADPWAFSLN